PSLFEQHVCKTPTAVALRCEDDVRTFAQLNTSANQLAHHLIAQGIGPGQLVAIALAPSFDMVIALLGVLKAGAAYLPLDPRNPLERLAFMIEDAGPARIITDRATANRLPSDADPLLLDAPDFRVQLSLRPGVDPTDRDRCHSL